MAPAGTEAALRSPPAPGYARRGRQVDAQSSAACSAMDKTMRRYARFRRMAAARGTRAGSVDALDDL